jgi:hypothetical protein
LIDDPVGALTARYRISLPTNVWRSSPVDAGEGARGAPRDNEAGGAMRSFKSSRGGCLQSGALRRWTSSQFFHILNITKRADDHSLLGLLRSINAGFTGSKTES